MTKFILHITTKIIKACDVDQRIYLHKMFVPKKETMWAGMFNVDTVGRRQQKLNVEREPINIFVL